MESPDGQTGFNFAALEDDAPETAPTSPAEYHPVSGVATLDSFDIGFEADDDGAPASPLPSSAPPLTVELPPAPPIGMESPAPPLQPNPDDIVARFLEVYKEKISAESFLDTEPLPGQLPQFPPDDSHDSTRALPEEFTDSETIVTGAYGAHEERPQGDAAATIAVADDLDRIPRRRRRATRMRETLIDRGEAPASVAMRPVPLFTGAAAEGATRETGAAPAPSGLLPSTLAWLRRLRGNYGRYKEIGVWPHLWGLLRGSRVSSRPPRSSIVADTVAENAVSQAVAAPAAPEESLDTVMDILASTRAEPDAAPDAPPDAPPPILPDAPPSPPPGEDGAPASGFASDPEIDALTLTDPGDARPEANADDEEVDILGFLDDGPTMREGQVEDAPDQDFLAGAGDEEEIGGEAPREPGMVKISGSLPPVDESQGDMIKISGTMPEIVEPGDGMTRISGSLPPVDESQGDMIKISGTMPEIVEPGDGMTKISGSLPPIDESRDGMTKISGKAPDVAERGDDMKKIAAKPPEIVPAVDVWRKAAAEGGGRDEGGGWKRSPGDGGRKDDDGGWKRSAGDGGLKRDEDAGWKRSAGDGGLKRDDDGGWKRVPADEATEEEAGEAVAETASDDLVEGVDASASVPLADLADEPALAAAATSAPAAAGDAAAPLAPSGASPTMSEGWDDVDLDMLEAAEAPAMPMDGGDLEAPLDAPGEADGAAAGGAETMAVPPIVARLWAHGQALVNAVGGGLKGLFKRRKKTPAPVGGAAGNASAPLPPVDEDVVIGDPLVDGAPAAAPEALAIDASPIDVDAPAPARPVASFADLGDILPTSDAAFSGADGDWPDTGPIAAGDGAAGFMLSGDVSLAGLGGLLGDDDFAEPAPGGDEAPARGWLVVAAVRAWERLVNVYKALDRVIDFHKNWWLLVDGLAVLIMTVSFAVILAYFLYYR